MIEGEKLGFIDVGARGGISERFGRFSTRLLPVLCEPEPEEYARLIELSQNGEKYKVIGRPLAHVDGRLTLHEAVNPFCSSIFPANDDFLAQYDIAKHFRLKEAVQVDCARYDTLFHHEQLPVPHIVKIDVQGFEYQVLQGFGALLHDCLAVEVEAHFYPLYRGQRLLQDIIDFLADFDLVLRRIHNGRSPQLNGDRHFEGDLVEVDAVFSKSKAWSKKQDSATRARLNLACEVMGVLPDR